MTLDAIIMGLGAVVAILPFLGFPNSWDNAFFFILGIVIAFLGIAVRRNAHSALMEKKMERTREPETFKENQPYGEEGPSRV